MTNINSRKRRQLLARDGIRIDDTEGYQVAYVWNCYLCRKRFRPEELEVEHKVPKGRGGGDNLDNLGLACTACNSEKANMTVEEYLEWRELPEEYKLLSLRYQGRRRLNKAKGLTYAIRDAWPEQ